MLKKRSRTVSFRLSDEEYQALKYVSTLSGARSVSEFTRSVACNANPDGNGNGTEKEFDKIDDQLRILYDRMNALDLSIQRLTNELQEKGVDYSPQLAGKEELS
jgi:hypothetical protein